MALHVLSLTPIDGSINLPIDSEFLIEFDQPIDPFTIANGISLYTILDGIWSGPDLAVLDTGLDDLHDVDGYKQYEFTYRIENNRLFIKPTISLEPDRTHYISILPGNDVNRYISALTVNEPIYERIGTSTGVINILSAYSGTINTSYILGITGNNTFDLIKGAQFIDSFTFSDNQELDLGDLKISLSGSFDIGDSVTLDVIKSQGVTGIYKTTFATSKYTTFTPQSQSLTVPPGNINSPADIPLRITSTIPDNLSFNNIKCNPITIRFSKNINPSQDFSGKIDIVKKTLDGNRSSKIKFATKVSGNTLKIYLISVE